MTLLIGIGFSRRLVSSFIVGFNSSEHPIVSVTEIQSSNGIMNLIILSISIFVFQELGAASSVENAQGHVATERRIADVHEVGAR